MRKGTQGKSQMTSRRVWKQNDPKQKDSNLGNLGNGTWEEQQDSAYDSGPAVVSCFPLTYNKSYSTAALVLIAEAVF